MPVLTWSQPLRRVTMQCLVTSRVAELVIYVFIFMRQTEIEKRAAVYIYKGDEPVSYRRYSIHHLMDLSQYRI